MMLLLHWLTWPRIVRLFNLDGNKSDIRKAGGLKHFVKLLDSPDPDVKKSSATGISYLLDDC